MPDFYGDARSRRDRYEAVRASLWNDRQSGFDSHWQELGQYITPRRTRFDAHDINKGDKRRASIIDSTAGFSARTLSSGLHAGLTSPARPWMKLTTPDPDLAKHPPVKEWLHEVTQRMLVIFNTTNLYNALPVTYGDLGTFGTAAISIMDDRKDLFRAYNYALGTFAIGLDERGLATTWVREYVLTVRQLVKEFAVREDKSIDWSKVSDTVKDLWDRSSYEAKVKVCWIVTPNEQADDEKLEAKYLPFASCHFEYGTNDEKKWLRESGYHQFPILVPRWDVTDGDAYGTDCPGMTALGDVKQLQIMQRKKGLAISKMVDPPLVGPPSLRTSRTSLIAGDITYADEREGMKGLRSIHDVNLRIDHLAEDVRDVQYRIQRAYYEDLFLMLARSDGSRGAAPVTAREVEERHEEKLLALGPVLERTNDELLDPLIDRVFGMMERAGMIPTPPQELDGVNVKPEYISIMAQAQKLVGVVGLDRLMQTVVGLFEVFPNITDKIDENQTIDNYGEMLGTDPRIIRSNEDAEQRQAARAEQQQMAQEAEMAKNVAGAVKDAGQTPLEGDTALSRMVGNMATV